MKCLENITLIAILNHPALFESVVKISISDSGQLDVVFSDGKIKTPKSSHDLGPQFEFTVKIF